MGPGANDFRKVSRGQRSGKGRTGPVTLAIERSGDVIRLRMSSVGSRAAGLDVSAYVLRGVMIDTGFPRVHAELLDAVRSIGVRGAIVTHWHEDHAGNVPMLAAEGIPIIARDDTLAMLRAHSAIRLYRRMTWGSPSTLASTPAAFDAGEFECIHTPGHSSDHQIVWDPVTATLFSGDLWLGVRARILHATEDPYRIVESLRAVRGLSPARMFDAHRGEVAHPPQALDAKIAWLGETLATVEERIRAGWPDREIVHRVLGGEERAAYVSRGEYSRRNLVRAVRRHLEAR